jgi:hypothetical protein
MKKFIKFIGYPITLIIGIVAGFTACLELARRAGILDKTDEDDVEYYGCDYDDPDYMPGINNVFNGDTDIDIE